MNQKKQVLHLFNPLQRSAYLNLSTHIGVYAFKKGKEFLYIGKSVQIKTRVLSHIENAKINKKEYLMVSQSDRIEIFETDTEYHALLLESKLIQTYKPKYNVIWKDDKSYLYIKITNEEYPKIKIVRKELDRNAFYYGPFNSQKETTALLRLIRMIIPFCMATQNNKPCFYQKLSLCNPCPGEISNLPNVNEKKIKQKQYINQINKIKFILEGKTDRIQNYLKKELSLCIQNKNYEKGILIRNKLYLLSKLLLFKGLDNPSFEYNRSTQMLQRLIQILSPYYKNISFIKRIECYDVSNMNQNYATASMVVMTDGLVDKSQYRKFKIKYSKNSSDIKMLSEVIKRRFRHKWLKPDLIIIDGGKPQIHAVLKQLEILNLTIPIIGIAKTPDRIIIPTSHLITLKLPHEDKGLQLIQLLRDESHRFAKKYHLFLRDSQMI